MRFMLRQGTREIELLQGRFVIGRAEDCALGLDDALVSRHHAALDVSETGVTLVDLGSRNGVRVNGERVDKERALAPGDVLAIGGASLTLALRRELMTDTIEAVASRPMSAFGLVGVLADKALALGRGEEAERLIGPQIDQLVEGVERGQATDAGTVEDAARYALRLASATGSGRWVDVVFRLHRLLRKTCSVALVDELYVVLRKVKQPSRVELRAYLDVLAEIEPGLGPAERFLVGRLEGLARLIG